MKKLIVVFFLLLFRFSEAQTFQQIHDSIKIVHKKNFDSLAAETDKAKLVHLDSFQVRAANDPNLILYYVIQKVYMDSVGTYKVEMHDHDSTMYVYYVYDKRLIKTVDHFPDRNKIEYYYPPEFENPTSRLKNLIEIPFRESKYYVNGYYSTWGETRELPVIDRSGAHSQVPYTIYLDSVLYMELSNAGASPLISIDTLDGSIFENSFYENSKGKLFKVESVKISEKAKSDKSVYYFLNNSLVKYKNSFFYRDQLYWSTVYFRKREVIYLYPRSIDGDIQEHRFLDPADKLLKIYYRHKSLH